MNGYKVEKGQVRCSGLRYNVNDVIKADLLTEKEREALVSNGVVSPVVINDDVAVVVVDVAEHTPPINKPNEVEPIEKTLELNFDYDELKDGAKAQGLEFKGNISRAALIDLIIESGKQDYFLEQLEDEEDEENL